MKSVNNKDKIINNLVGNTLYIEFPDGDEDTIISNEGNVVAESMTLKQSISEDGKLGGCIASEFSIQLMCTENRQFSTDIRGKWINVSIVHTYAVPQYPSNELYPSNDLYPGDLYYTEKVRLFSGYIDVAERDQSDSTKISITAYDIFAKMNTLKCTQKVVDLFKNKYEYSGTLRKGAPLSAHISLCTSKNPIKKLPFKYDDIYDISSADWETVASTTTGLPLTNKSYEKSSKDVTYGDILRWICELLGAYAVIKPNDKYGELRIIAKGTRETYESYFSFNAEDYETYPYSGIIIPYYYYKAPSSSTTEDERIDELTAFYEGDTNYLTVCFAPPSLWLVNNNTIHVTVEYYQNDNSSTISKLQGDLVKSNKRITKEEYVNDYGDRVLYASNLFISNPDVCKITKIIFYDDKGHRSTWNKNNESVSEVNKTAHILNSDTAATLLDAVSDFSFYDMTDNIFAWDEVRENASGSVEINLQKINQFYNNCHLKHRIPNCQFRPFTATVEGRTWVEVGDLVTIKVPDTDFDGGIYDSATGQKMDCDGFIVDETGAYVYTDGTVIPYDEDTGEYASKPIVGTVRTKDVESIILSRTLTGIQALTDVLEAKDNN
ncbi:MAG: hypothetical protein ACI4RM_02915 [Ruminococcus sp.]